MAVLKHRVECFEVAVAAELQQCPKWVAPLIPVSTLGVLLIPALLCVVPSSEVSLARIWGLGGRRAGKFTVVASIVRPLQSSVDDGASVRPAARALRAATLLPWCRVA